MAGKMTKKAATGSAKSVLASVLGGTPKSCSKAGSKLATDKLPASKKASAGKKLGSMACKAPSRRTKVGKR